MDEVIVSRLLGYISSSLAPATAAVLESLLGVLLTLYLARAARRSFERATVQSGADPAVRILVGRLIYLGILALGLTSVLYMLGINPTALVAALGAVGLAISLAVQDILKNFFAGIYLLFERPFRIGDEISVKEYVGTVQHVGARTTSLRTKDGVLVMIPNSIVFVEILSNRTSGRAEAESAAVDGNAEKP